MGKKKKAGRVSAGLILYRSGPAGLEVLIAHMGGPLWAKKERGWSIPKRTNRPPIFRPEAPTSAPVSAARTTISCPPTTRSRNEGLAGSRSIST